jgi:hypothetical protein
LSQSRFQRLELIFKRRDGDAKSVFGVFAVGESVVRRAGLVRQIRCLHAPITLKPAPLARKEMNEPFLTPNINEYQDFFR